MHELPWLVVHGAVVAKVLIVALAAVVLGITELWRRRRERARTRFEVHARADALTGLAAGYASLRGTLHGTATTLTSIEGTTGNEGFTRSAELAVDVGGERVVLTGDVLVIRGTRGAAGWRHVPGTPAALVKDRWDLVAGRRRLFSVVDGDDVIVQGVIARDADPAATAGYRDDASAWTMRAMSNLPAIELVAMQPASVPAARGPLRLAAVAALALLVSYGALRELGALLLEHADRAKTAELGVPSQLAAALPGARGKALGNLWWQLRAAPRGAATDDQVLALAELRDGCTGRATWWLEHEQFEDVVAGAAGCAPDTAARVAGAAEAEVRALAHLGRYAEAAERVAQHPGVLQGDAKALVTIEIGAGRWRDAADAADLEAARLEALGHETPSITDLSRQWSTRVRCVAAWLRIKAGDPSASVRLAELAQVPGVPGCAVAAALPLPDDQRTAALTAILDHDRYGEDGRLARGLLWVAAGDDERPTLASRFIAIGADPWTWLAPFAVDDSRDTDERRDSLHGRRALYAMITGDAARATREAGAVVGNRRDDLVAAVALRTPETPIAWVEDRYGDSDLGREVAMRNGAMRKTPYRSGECATRVDAALPAAIAGDGLALATALDTSCDEMSSALEVLLGVAPRVTQHRAELAGALQRYTGQRFLRDELPFQYTEYAAFRRDVLRLTGDGAGAARWQARIAAQAQAMADRERLTAWLLWQL